LAIAAKPNIKKPLLRQMTIELISLSGAGIDSTFGTAVEICFTGRWRRREGWSPGDVRGEFTWSNLLQRSVGGI